jgi:signal transduction histidine kinase
LLALGRRQFLLPAVLDLNSVVEDMKGMLARLIGEHIELVTRLNSGTCRIKADLSQIEQVILNLVINARDAMSEGGTLTIQTSVEGPYAVLSVTDTDTGIDPDTLQLAARVRAFLYD